MTTNVKWSSLNPKLCNALQKCLSNDFKFDYMMPVQKVVIPLFLKHYDVAVEAQTGSGKTLAFLIPIFNAILKQSKAQKIKNGKLLMGETELYAAIIAPTRELAKQIYDVCVQLIGWMKLQLKVQVCIGGYNHTTVLDFSNVYKLQDIERMKEGCNLIVGCPGKLRQIFEDKLFIELVKLNKLEYLVFDEADRLINNEFWGDIQVIVDKLPKQRRTGLFSATLSAAKVGDLIKMGLRNPVRVSVEVQDEDKVALPQTLVNRYKVLSSRSEKFRYLINFLAQKIKGNLKIIIFFNTCASVEYYTLLLHSLEMLENCQITNVHGQMKQKKRAKLIEQFMQQEQVKQTSILVTTDVVARGIDFTDVNLIIQFDPPQDPSQFVHRVGRTARQGRDGEALILLEQCEINFIRFLKSKDIKLVEYDLNIDENYTFEYLKEYLTKMISADRDIIEKGKRAFVSFIRSYKEHKLQLIFPFNKLNIGHVADSFFLLRMPRIKEILGKSIDFKQSEVNPNLIKFKDSNKEKQFNERRQQKEQKSEVKLQKQVQPKRIDFQTQYKGQEVNIKNNKSLRKKVKGMHQDEDMYEMEEEQRLVKKLKQGRISLQQFNAKMKEIDPEDLNDIDFEQKVI